MRDTKPLGETDGEDVKIDGWIEREHLFRNSAEWDEKIERQIDRQIYRYVFR